MKRFHIAYILVLACALCFTACGDDSGSGADDDGKGGETSADLSSEADISVGSFDDLVKCTSKREGVTAYVKDEGSLFVCADGEWVEDDGSGDNDGRKESSSSVKSSSSAKSSSSSVASSSSKKSKVDINGKSEYDPDANTLKDLRDGQTYKTVVIGSQVWMAENLNYAYTGIKYEYGTYRSESTSWCYNGNADSCAKFGRLYTWSAAMDSAAVFGDAGKGCGDGKTCYVNVTVRGVCPAGWHLPSKAECNSLFAAVGGNAGSKLKSTSGWYNSGDGSDSLGFTVLPAGARIDAGYFSKAGYYAYFWTSSENGNTYASHWRFKYHSSFVDLSSYDKHAGLSVRCVMDSEESEGASLSSSLVESSSSSVKSSSSAKSSSSSVASSSSEKSKVDINGKSEYDPAANTLKDLRDGQTYKTVVIGEQTWMAENLNYAYIGIKFGSYGYKSDSTSWCYKNSADSCSKYGRLYTWAAAMDSAAVFSDAGKGCGYGYYCKSSGTVRGVCPSGWHLPDTTEWKTLFTAVGGASVAGAELKSTSGWVEDGNGTDSFGFAVLPAGRHTYEDRYADGGYLVGFWTSSAVSSYSAYFLEFNYGNEDVIRYTVNDYSGYSVRCVMDESAVESIPE